MTTPVSDERIEAIRGRYPGTVGNNQYQSDMRALLDAIRERDKLIELHVHQVIACGVAAHNPHIARKPGSVYQGKWLTQQLEDVLKLADERDALKQKVSEGDATIAELRTQTRAHHSCNSPHCPVCGEDPKEVGYP